MCKGKEKSENRHQAHQTRQDDTDGTMSGLPQTNMAHDYPPDRPDQLIPFAEKFLWAKDNDRALYNDLAKLVIRSNYAYVMNPNRLSSYYSANLSVTKEIGDHVSVSFYANNFFNTMRKVHSSQTDLETSLFGSGYVPSYYYGLSLRLKI